MSLSFGALHGFKFKILLFKVFLSVLILLTAPLPSYAQSMSAALAHAYLENPDLNQQRAATRASDEGVPRAASSYHPQVGAILSIGYNYVDGNESASGGVPGVSFTTPDIATKTNSFPKTVSVSISQNLFNGYQTTNAVRQAESGIMQAREQIRNTEQTTLLNGATAYMNVMRDIALLTLNKNNITVLEEQVRQSKRRQEIGAFTPTDVAQAESSLATARSNYFTVRANLQTSVAGFRQVIGIEPTQLQPARAIEDLLPPILSQAIDIALAEHPAIQSAFHNVDAAESQVHIYEGQLLPSIDLIASVQGNDQYTGIPQNRLFNASILAQISVPIYNDTNYGQVRQAKESLSRARIEVDVQRDMVRANVVTAWNQLVTAKATIISSRAAVRASEIALTGIRNEAKYGHRTTLDILLAQQALLKARTDLVTAERDRVVAGYAVMAATGCLSAQSLSLEVVPYDPTIHYEQVKDKWFGLRAADGR